MSDFHADYFDPLSSDPLIRSYIAAELDRQQQHIELIASENFASPAVMAAQGSILTNKYAEGYPGKRYYGGCLHVDSVEREAIARVTKLFSVAYANVQPHSGAQANMAVYYALLAPGDTVLGMGLAAGGHLTHGTTVSFSGKWFNAINYGVRESDGCLDYDQLEELALQHRPRLIIAGGSAYSRIIDFARFREIADKIGAYLMVDMAHFAGLVAGGVYPNPCNIADVVTSTTHKTLRGPRGGIILTRDEKIIKKINSAVFPGTQGGPLMHVIAAKAIAFNEALQPDFKEYASQIIKNAQTLATELQKNGCDIITGGTDSHLMLVDLRRLGVTGIAAEKSLESVNITCNKNGIPFDPLGASVTSGIRLGTPAMTTRGFKEKEMKSIARLIKMTLEDLAQNKEAEIKISEQVKRKVLEEVKELCEKYKLY